MVIMLVLEVDTTEQGIDEVRATLKRGGAAKGPGPNWNKNFRAMANAAVLSMMGSETYVTQISGTRVYRNTMPAAWHRVSEEPEAKEGG